MISKKRMDISLPEVVISNQIALKIVAIQYKQTDLYKKISLFAVDILRGNLERKFTKPSHRGLPS
jgi:uncharacterized protein YehS (DUF1456 family)